MVKVRVPASTSNLAAGFDAIGLALDLNLEVEMGYSDDTLRIEYSGEGGEEIAVDERNLLYKSALNVFRLSGSHAPPLNIRINNPIPLSRGLGSSGAAAIAGMMAANRLAGAGLSQDDILAMAVRYEGHPENVSASLLGGLTLSAFGSEGVISRRVALADDRVKVSVVVPDILVPTPSARKVLPATVAHKDAVFNLQRSALLTYALLKADYGVLRHAMQDRLHQPYRKHLIPGYDHFEQKAYENNGLGVAISGSGSAMICFVLDDGSAVESAWQAAAEDMKMTVRTMTLSISNEGARIVA